MHKTYIDEPFPEEATALIEAQVADENDQALPGPSVTTATMTLYNEADGQIINSRQDTDVLADIGTDGKLLRTLTDLDMIIVDHDRAFERHVAEFNWTYGGGKIGRALVIFTVENMQKVT